MSSASAILEEQNRTVLARAKPFAAALHRMIFTQGEKLVTAYARGELELKKSGDGYRFEKKDEVTQIGALIERYGLRTARDANVRAQQLVLRSATAREPIISEWEGYQIGIGERSDQVTFETESAFLREIQRVVEDAQAHDFTPTHTEIARELRARLTGKTSFDNFVPGGLVTGFDGAFTYERAARIARTELAIAENTGAVEGYKDAGIEEIEWLGYRSPVWPRRHDKMIGKKRRIDGPLFTLPSGVTLRFPGDPSAPVGEIVHCRCSIAPASKAKPKPPKPEPSKPEPINAPEPVEAPKPTFRTVDTAPLEYANSSTAPKGSFDVGELARGLAAIDKPHGQTEIRKQLNELAASVGMFSTDITQQRPKNDNYRVGPMPVGANAYHSFSGEIVMDAKVNANIEEFAKGSRTVAAIDGMRIAVHEAVHGHSPITPNVYQKAGRWIEEVTTELGAREIMDRQFNAAEHLKNDGAAWGGLRAGSYQPAIEKTRRVIYDNLPKGSRDSLDDVERKMRAASVKMRQEKTAMFASSDDYLRHFVNALDWDDARRDKLFDALKKVLDTYAG